MPIGRVEISMPDGTWRNIFIGSYNPADAHSQAVSQAFVEMACDYLRGKTLAEIHDHIRRHHPREAGMLDYVEAGNPMPVEYAQRDWPTTPGAEAQEIPIITALRNAEGVQ